MARKVRLSILLISLFREQTDIQIFTTLITVMMC